MTRTVTFCAERTRDPKTGERLTGAEIEEDTMSAPWIVLVAIVALAAVYVLLPVVGAVFVRYRGTRGLTCPETGADAKVRVDARWAAFTAAFRHPILRVKSCSLWPEKSGCEQSCLGLPESEKREPLRPAESVTPGASREL